MTKVVYLVHYFDELRDAEFAVYETKDDAKNAIMENYIADIWNDPLIDDDYRAKAKIEALKELIISDEIDGYALIQEVNFFIN